MQRLAGPGSTPDHPIFDGPDDLALVISPYLAGCDIDVSPPPLGEDPGDFDPKREAKHAKTFLPRTRGVYLLDYALSGAGFDFVPSPERAEWYAERVKAHHQFHASRVPSEVLVAITAGRGSLLEDLWTDFTQSNPIRWLMARTLMTDEFRREARARIEVPAELTRQERYGAYLHPAVMQMAAVGGFESELAELFAGAAPSKIVDPLTAIFACPARAARLALVTLLEGSQARVNIECAQPALVSLGAGALGLLTQSADAYDAKHADLLVSQVAGIAHGPGAAGFMVDRLGRTGATAATEWLHTHPEAVVHASLTPAQIKKLTFVIRSWEGLDALVARATNPAMAETIRHVADERDTIELDPATGWWAEASAGVKPVQTAPSLPPLIVDGARLTDAELRLLLGALAAASDEMPALVRAVKERIPRHAADEFALAMFDEWLTVGAPAKEKWRMVSAGFLGGDAFVSRLTPLIREWPGQSQHQRSVAGLTALRNVGTDLALQQIAAIAAKAKFAGIKKRAAEAMSEIAQARGMTRDQLEDRIIPDGGLDGRGKRVFDYGPRQFQASLTSESKVVVRLLDASGRPTGKPKTTLPAPNKSDDPEKAAEAKAEYGVLKKTLTTLAKTQSERFERAMVTARRWSPEEFGQFIAPQPVLRGLLAGVVWAQFDGDSVTGLFRLDEDGTPVDANDEPVEVTGPVGVIHPLALSPEQRDQWGQVLGDYDLSPAFPQLDRPVTHLAPDQGDDTALHEVPATPVPAGRLMGVCTKQGWERGAPQDAGVTCAYSRPNEPAGLTPVIVHENGMWMGSPTEMDDQRITEVFLLRGVVPGKDIGYAGKWDFEHHKWEKVPWSTAPAALVSEVYLTIHALFA